MRKLSSNGIIFELITNSVIILYSLIQIVAAFLATFLITNRNALAAYFSITSIILVSEAYNSYYKKTHNILFNLKWLKKLQIMIYITIGLLAIIPTLLEMWLGGSMYQTPQHILSNITLAFAGGFMLRHIIKIHEQSGGFFNEIFSAHYTLLSFNQIIFLVTSVGYPLIFLNMNNSSFDFLSTWFNLAFMIIMIYFITMPSFYLTYFLLSPKCTGLRFRNVFPWRPLSLGFIHLLCWSMFVFFKPDISLESTFYIIFIALVVVSGFWFIHSAKKTHMKANKRLRLCLIMVIICLVGYLGSVYLKYGTGVGVISFKYMPWIYFGMGFLLLLAIWTFVVILIYCQKERE